MNRSKYIQFAVTFLLVLGFAAPAMAKGAPKGDLNAPLGAVKWGDSRQDVVKKVKEQLLDAMRKDDKLKGNRVALQREHTRVLNQVDEFDASYRSSTPRVATMSASSPRSSAARTASR